jgi:DNA-binding NarL/FixJ family response regulator
MVGRCLVNKQIAAELGCSEKTVRNHIAAIYRKMARIVARNLQPRVALALLVRGYTP